MPSFFSGPLIHPGFTGRNKKQEQYQQNDMDFSAPNPRKEDSLGRKQEISERKPQKNSRITQNTRERRRVKKIQILQKKTVWEENREISERKPQKNRRTTQNTRERRRVKKTSCVAVHASGKQTQQVGAWQLLPSHLLPEGLLRKLATPLSNTWHAWQQLASARHSISKPSMWKSA